MTDTYDPIRETLEYHFKPILEFFQDETITDLEINPDGKIFIEHRDGTTTTPKVSIDGDSIKAVALLLASRTQNDVTEASPSVASVWENPSLRLHILLPPAVTRPSMAVRRFSNKVYSLDDFIKMGTCTEEQATILRTYIQQRRNLVVSGETGSGKTTLLNALLLEIPARDRVFIIEDTCELQCNVPNRFPVAYGYAYTAQMALKDALRLNPDRIIVGEVRDGSALDMLQAWNTGHPGGLASIHANSVDSVKLRLRSLVEQVSASSQMDLINETVDVAIQMSVDGNGRRWISDIRDFRRN